jgi:acyl-CoA synthetase (AMP-forming)/AMP-acid ligase II
MVLDDPTYSPARLSSASVRELAYGGSPMPRGLLDRLLADMAGVDIVQGYGMTEGLFVSILSAEDHRAGGERCEAVHAVVVPHPGATVTAEELVAHARGRIAAYKVPGRSSCVASRSRSPVPARPSRGPFWAGRDRAIS